TLTICTLGVWGHSPQDRKRAKRAESVFSESRFYADVLQHGLPQSPVTTSRAQRFTITKRLLDAAFDFQERIIEANAMSDAARADLLRQADADLRKLKLYLRLAHRQRWLSDGQYKHVSTMAAEVGKLLGGWLRATRSNKKRDASGPLTT
ncbi:MAG: four helix bundle protein, partial [Anaerolineae bacterium]|nr:four helix bundle protein [Anaerolineae bacterium]